MNVRRKINFASCRKSNSREREKFCCALQFKLNVGLYVPEFIDFCKCVWRVFSFELKHKLNVVQISAFCFDVVHLLFFRNRFVTLLVLLQ